MSREFLPGIHWIQECGPNRVGIIESAKRRPENWYVRGRAIHIPQNAYLFVGEKTLLFDTLSPAGRDQIVFELRAILGDRPLDYLVVSHPDTPHAGNTFSILGEYPRATLVAPKVGSTHALYHLDQAMKVGPGDEIDLGGHRLKFHEATFLDAAISIWMTEEESGLLLPVDWLGVPHHDSECLKCADEISSELTVERFLEFHGRVFFWYQYVDLPKVIAEIDRIIRKFNPKVIAPAHGVVIREDAAQFMDLIKQVVERVHADGRIGGIG